MTLLTDIKDCKLCKDHLPLDPKPILQMSKSSSLLIIGQAPGIKAHETGRPWNDSSGQRLRRWLEISSDDFYDSKTIAIVPMGFCYPGKGLTGDLPPRRECRVRWMDTVLCHLNNIQMTILVGAHAVDYFLGEGELASKIKLHASTRSPFIVLPHPSPTNNRWLAKNKWFELEALPKIRKKLSSVSS